jgi:WD40 repeat protein
MPASPIRVFEILPEDRKGNSVAFTPFGLLLFPTRNQIVEANVTTGKRGRTFTAGKTAITCFALASATHRLAALAEDGTVFLWNTATGKQLQHFKLRDGSTSSRADYELAISPEGKYLAVSGSGDVRVYDMMTGRMRKSFSYIYDAVFAPDGKTLFLGGARRLQAWNVATWQPRCARKLGDSLTHPTFTAIDCSPNGKQIAGGVVIARPDYTLLAVIEGKTLKEVWTTETGTLEFIAGVSQVIYSPSGNRIAVGIRHYENFHQDVGVSLHLYNAQNGEKTAQYQVKKTIRSLAFSRNGKYLAALTDCVTVWPVIS